MSSLTFRQQIAHKTQHNSRTSWTREEGEDKMGSQLATGAAVTQQFFYRHEDLTYTAAPSLPDEGKTDSSRAVTIGDSTRGVAIGGRDKGAWKLLWEKEGAGVNAKRMGRARRC